MIVVENFSKTYEDTLAVDRLSFHVESGQVLGLVGRNGAGKTTTLRSLTGIIPYASGTLKIDGYEVSREPIGAKRVTAYVPDDPQLFLDLTVEQHLKFTASVYGIRNPSNRISELLGVFELEPKRHTAASDLSRGMRQKLAICCAELSRPRALLLDEPMTGLDPQAIRVLKSSIKTAANRGTAVIISSHLLAMVEDICTHALILDSGRRKFFGTLDQLREEFSGVQSQTTDASLENAYFAAISASSEDRLADSARRPVSFSLVRSVHMFGESLMHPALIQLQGYQSRARFHRLIDAVRSPRRKIATALGLMLALVWLGQAIVSICFRESADPARLSEWIPLGMFCYTLWHLLKIVARKPVEPFEWTPAETELLLGAPVSRLQIICFRLMSIFRSAVVKSLIFSLLMIPDLNYVWAGFLGMLAGLLLVDLARTLIELACYGLSKTALNLVRCALFGSVTLWVGNSLWICLEHVNAMEELASPAALIFAKHWLNLLTAQLTTSGRWLLLPFQPAVSLILASEVDWRLALNGLMACSLVCMASSGVLALDAGVLKLRKQRELKHLAYRNNGRTGQRVSRASNQSRRVHVPVRLSGMGSIAWRQLRGAYHYRATLAVSLGLPTMLCCLPLLATHGQYHMLINLVSGLIFYSFLLLPAALMLDFRRDAHRIDVLKSLPISPLAITLGQLAVPVGLCSLFQWTVLSIGIIAGAISFWQMIIAGILLIPFSVFIFATENLVFMIAPYRRNQEGVMTFIRTILTFTAKGIFLLLVLAGVIAWAAACRKFGGCFSHPLLAQQVLFGCGIWIFTCLFSVAITWQLSRVYDRFDPSLDAPGVS